MNENVVLSGAEQDLFIHYCDLERRSEGRGDRMNTDFLATLDLLGLNPHMGAQNLKSIRKWSMLDWGLGIYYAVEGGRNMILAVQHLRQNPKKIRAILKSRMPQ